MLKWIVSGIMVALLFIGMLTFAVEIKPIKGEWTGGTIYIRADGSIDPPDAPIITYDNITYTLTDNIVCPGDGIVIERSNIILDGIDHHIEPIIYNSYTGIQIQQCNNVTIKNMNIENFYGGIFAQGEGNFFVKNCITSNELGLEVSGSFDVFSENNITNSLYGIFFHPDSSNANITKNYFENCKNAGIDLRHTNYDVISENIFVNSGLLNGYSYNNIVVNNTVNGKPLTYLENFSNATIEDSGQVILVNCDAIRIENMTLSFTNIGIELVNTRNTTITGNRIYNCSFYGVYLLQSSNNTITANNLTSNEVSGLCLIGDSNYNNISQNVFVGDGLRIINSYHNVVVNNAVNGKPLVYLEGNSNVVVENAGQVVLVSCTNIRIENLNLSYTSAGIELLNTSYTNIYGNELINSRNGIIIFYGSCYNNISKNNIVGNRGNGISVWASDAQSQTISGNVLSNNFAGIYLQSSFNIIYGNNILNNRWCGVYCLGGINTFFHNNFINNEKQIIFQAHGGHVWDDGYPSGGNYWSDYAGVDFYSGPYQNETGSDGIGDTPYIIDANNVDNYPLMGPFGGLTMEGQNVTAFPSSEVCLIYDNVTVAGLTTANIIDVGPEPPSGFKLAENYYDIKTTANYSGTIRLRIAYDDSNMTAEEEANLCLLHWDESLQEWTNITTAVDIENNIICGETTHLSTFAFAVPYIPGDVDRDLKVKMDDIILLCDAFGSKIGQPNYDPNCDINSDGKISMDDIIIAVEHFGQHYP
ncbi:MAG: NosD domain-containing protein [Candidatus Bathyarchaeia archaeon]